MIKSIKRTFKLHKSFSGRSNRKEFCFFQLFSILVLLALFGINIVLLLYLFSSSLSGLFQAQLSSTAEWMLGAFGIVSIFVLLALTWFQIALYVRRLHDINKSGHWLWISQTPFFVYLVYYIINFKEIMQAYIEGYSSSKIETSLLLLFIGYCCSFALFLICCLERGDRAANKYGEPTSSTLSPAENEIEEEEKDNL